MINETVIYLTILLCNFFSLNFLFWFLDIFVCLLYLLVVFRSMFTLSDGKIEVIQE